MNCELSVKYKNRRGLTYFTVLLMLLVLAMLITVLTPVFLRWRDEACRFGCFVASSSARRQLAAESVLIDGAPEAEEIVDEAKNGREDLCVAGGTTYLVENTGENETPFDIVCGLHGNNRKQCTRCNACSVLEQVAQQVRLAQDRGEPFPTSVTVQLHHRDVIAILVDDYTGIHCGTARTDEYDGVVAFYAIVGHSSFGEGSGLKEGSIWYFSYADEEHYAAWSNIRGWTGDSYE